ncbi:MAG: 3-oxoacyl-ACP synthase [Candidatus Aminicenantes bacterium RBG_13_62_12]|nr:MAG: 3-oxoacyl-ACP synthase [Candidatus Aminicenantes bacterium RBG_13_62_12]
MSIRAVITGTGRCLPPRVVTNADMEKLVNTSDAWIRERSGILERRWAEPGTGPSDLAVEAARQAIDNAGIAKDDIDFIIAATLSPDYYFPGIGVLVQAKLGLPNIGALDVRNQCSGFIYALSVADQYIRAGTYKKILLVAAEVQSTSMDFSDQGRDMSVLFGDGGGAVIIEPHESDGGRGILSTHLFCDGRFATELWMEHPSPKNNPSFQLEMFTQRKTFPRMDGRKVFINAVERMPEAILVALAHNGLDSKDLSLVIPHQANDRISQMVIKKLQLSEDKVVRNIQRYGNTTAASIPIALDEVAREGRLKRGDLLALTAFGSGFTWASALIRW